MPPERITTRHHTTLHPFSQIRLAREGALTQQARSKTPREGLVQPLPDSETLM
jgi:hypothetical protein